ncbi:MAG: aminotransferase class I/II-fold pyridoxal phosphate-dependent enzyme [Pseudomonadota bacterium]
MSTHLAPFQAIAISKLAFALEKEGRDVIHLEFGQPEAPPPPRALTAAHDAITQGVPGYWESDQLKERIASLYTSQLDPSQVFLTCGASPALAMAFGLCFSPGDRIAVARPGYIAYRNVLKGLHLEPVEIACDATTRFQLTAKQIASLSPAPKGLIISSPGNPTGSVIPEDELRQIAKACKERGIQIISDEIYHKLIYDTPVPSMADIDPSAIIINSFSKYYCMPGWRLGWLIAPPDKIDAATAYLGNFFLNAPTISQKVGLSAMDETQYLDANIQTYRDNRALMLSALPDLGLADIAPPDGAFYLYANISHLTKDSLDFCRRLLTETGVAATPGIDFDPVDGHRFIRFSFAVSTPSVERALDRLVPFFSQQ